MVPPVRRLVATRKPATFEDSLYTITGKPAKRGHTDGADIGRMVAAYYYDNDSLAAPDGWDAGAKSMFSPSEQREGEGILAHEMGHRIDTEERGGHYSIYRSMRDPRPYHRPDLVNAFDKNRRDKGLVGDTLPETASFNARRGPDEQFAEAFSQAVQFLRDTAKPLGATPRDDAAKAEALRAHADQLAPGASVLINQMLASEPIYANHRLKLQQQQAAMAVRPDATNVRRSGLYARKP